MPSRRTHSRVWSGFSGVSTYLMKSPTKKKTPQSQPIPEKDMAKNNAGGYAFKADSFSCMERFLGSEHILDEVPDEEEDAAVAADPREGHGEEQRRRICLQGGLILVYGAVSRE